MRQKLLWGMTLLSASCTNYHSNFDSPAFPGVGCRSLSQIEAMIIEHENGEDCFLGSCPFHKEAQVPELIIDKAGKQRIWICPHANAQGHYIDGHYIYFELENGEKITAIREMQK